MRDETLELNMLDPFPLQCRTCLNKLADDSKFLFCNFNLDSDSDQMTETQTLAESIQHLSGTLVLQGDNLPEFICPTCYDCLCNAMNFIKNVRKSDKILRGQQEPVGPGLSTINIETTTCLSKKQFDELEIHNGDPQKNNNAIDDSVDEMKNGLKIKTEIISDDEIEKDCVDPDNYIKEELDVEFDNVENHRVLLNGNRSKDIDKLRNYEWNKTVNDNCYEQKHLCSSSCTYMKRSRFFQTTKGVSRIQKVWELVEMLIKENQLKTNEVDITKIKTQISSVIASIDKKFRKCRNNKKRFLHHYGDWLESEVHISYTNDGSDEILSSNKVDTYDLANEIKMENTIKEEDLESECSDIPLHCLLCPHKFETLTELKGHVNSTHSYNKSYYRIQNNENKRKIALVHLKPSEDPEEIIVTSVKWLSSPMNKTFSGESDQSVSLFRHRRGSNKTRYCGYCKAMVTDDNFRSHIVECFNKSLCRES